MLTPGQELPFPDAALPEALQQAVQAIVAVDSADKKEEVKAFNANSFRRVSEYASALLFAMVLLICLLFSSFALCCSSISRLDWPARFSNWTTARRLPQAAGHGTLTLADSC
jgi:hypothetical protein